MKKLILVLFILFSVVIYSQNIDYSAKYPNEDVITLRLKKHIDISIKNKKLNILEHVEKQNFFITTENLNLASESISYNTFNNIEEITAFTKIVIDGKEKFYKVNDFTDKDVLVNGIFFTDRKEKKFAFKNVTKNAITNLKYTRKIKDPHFIPAFIIANNLPIENATFSVSFPNNVEVSFKTFNIDSTKVHFTKKISNHLITYTWQFSEIPKISRHYDFSPLYYIPQIVIRIKSYQINGITNWVLKDVDDLYKWYNLLNKNINTTNQEKLKEITKDITKNITNEEEKIKTIYYFVQDRINYIAFEDGLNGFIPRDAMNIYNNKYGDCKDMSNLLNEMLHYANIKSYLTWIGTRDRPYTYEELPTVLTNNHMITAVKIDNEIHFLDATAKYLPYGFPSPNIQGKQALIGTSDNDYNLIIVPEVSAEKSGTLIKSSLQLNNLNLIGTHQAFLFGFDKLNFRHQYEHKSNEDLDFLFWNLDFGTKKTSFLNINYKNIAIEKDSSIISFTSKTNDYAREIAGKIYLKLNLDHTLKGELVRDEGKKFDKKINYKYHKTFYTNFKIPDGYTVEFLPENSNFTRDNYHFSIEYQQTSGKISVTKNITINTLKIPVSSIDEWNHFIKKLSKENKRTIILSPIKK